MNTRIVRTLMIAIVLAVAPPGFAQEAQRTAEGGAGGEQLPPLGEAAARALNEAIELMNAGNYAEAKTVAEDLLLIAISSTGEIWMDRREVEVRDLRLMIERFHIERPDDAVVIIADRNSEAGLVAEVMDMVRAGGIESVHIAAAPPGGG
jgi:biopolymer transport protein ExbD